MASKDWGYLIGRAAIGLGLILLAAQPAGWLARTWFSPAYGSHGFYIFLLAAAIFGSSLASPLTGPSRRARAAWAVLVLTALIRLAGARLAVNTIGALALVLDVWALATLAGLDRRRRAASPFWLAALFALSLPVERLVQRAAGFGLQLVSAQGAGGLLNFFWDVQVQGARIILNGRDILVDLPCSGARGLMLSFILLAALMALVRPSFRQSLLAAAVTLTGALAGNVLRISLLAVGLAFPEKIFNINVMAQPWHDLIGLAALGISALPLLGLARRFKGGPPAGTGPDSVSVGPPPAARPLRPVTVSIPGLIFLAAALVIVHQPGRPLDVSRPVEAIHLPAYLGGHYLEPQPLSAEEAEYFTRYGGQAVKGLYGQNGLMMVRTASPLRHLHAPDECLKGLGFSVEYLGLDFTGLPSAVYKAVSPDGLAYRVAVSFFSSSGRVTTSVTEAAWYWLGHGRGTWTAVQRLTPWSDESAAGPAWDAAVAAALDLPAAGPELARQRLERFSEDMCMK